MKDYNYNLKIKNEKEDINKKTVRNKSRVKTNYNPRIMNLRNVEKKFSQKMPIAKRCD